MKLKYLLLLLCCVPAFAQDMKPEATLPLLRQVKGQTLVSSADPAAEFIFAKDFHYAGGQRFVLYKVADAEQHFFVKADPKGSIERFYWVQFEHYLPDNKHTYNYPSPHSLEIGGLKFICDTESSPDYQAANADPESDGGKARIMLAQKGLSFPKRAARLRMMHLVGSDRRAELMIIYGEVVPETTKMPLSEDFNPLDDVAPEIVKTVREHAIAGMSIRAR